MAFIPYSCQNIDQDDIDAVVAALRSPFLTQGPAVEIFEKEFAARHHIAHGIAVANATAGLHIACLALDVDAACTVWTSPNSFVASANCALYCGARVDFVDIDPVTRNMSVEALRKKLEMTEPGDRPQVVIPVDFSGLPADLRAIRALADQYHFKIIEDASHATGAIYEGQPVGSAYADITVFSFHAVKVVTTGEGGLVATNNAALAAGLRQLRAHGITRDQALMEHPAEGAWYYEQISLGFNYRMTDFQAALGSSQLRRLSAMQARREALAQVYDRLLAGLPLILPPRLPNCASSWHLYVVEIDETRSKAKRAAVFQAMREADIGVNVHYIPIHTQPFYTKLGFKPGDFPAAEHYYQRAMSLPLFPALTEDQQAFVVKTLAKALG